jgi:pilus assembly protein CpaC
MTGLSGDQPHFARVSGGPSDGRSTALRRLNALAYLLAGCGLACSASQLPAQEQWVPVPPTVNHYGAAVPPAPSAVPAAPAIVADAGGRHPGNRALPEQISSMPTVSENMDVVQHRSQLVIARTNIVRTAVADPSIIDVVQYSPNELSIIGLELGSTTLTLWFDNSHQPLIYLVNTVRDPGAEEKRRVAFSKLERKLAVLFPNSKVYLIPFSGKLVVKGQAHDSEEAAKILQIVRGEVAVPQPAPEVVEQPKPNAPNKPPLHHRWDDSAPAATDIVNMLEVPGEFQVMLRVRIAELNRSMLRSMGVNLNNVLFDRRHTVQQIKNTPCRSLAGIFENGEINAAVGALTGNGTAKILSEPVLTVVSGHSASFLSGGEFAVPTIVGVDGVGAQQTSFHGFGTSLVVTPVVLDHDLIRMNINPEFSQLDSANTVNGIPGVDTRRAQTTVQLREGQTIVLAGLISHQTNTQTAKVVFWGDVPIVGPLFSGKRSAQEETELLILVTPEIVRPMDADEVPPVPGHEVTVPNNCQFFKLGRTEGCPDTNVYQAGPYGSGQTTGVPVGFQTFNAGPGAPAMGPAPTDSNLPTAPNMSPAPGASPDVNPQAQPLRRTSSYGGSDPAGGPIQQTSATFVSPDPGPPAAQPNTPLKWYQRPFRSFGWSQSTPQRPADATDPAAVNQSGPRGNSVPDQSQPVQP